MPRAFIRTAANSATRIAVVGWNRILLLVLMTAIYNSFTCESPAAAYNGVDIFDSDKNFIAYAEIARFKSPKSLRFTLQYGCQRCLLDLKVQFKNRPNIVFLSKSGK